MKHYSKKTPVIKDGIGKPLAEKLLDQIHGCRGLVHYLETSAAIGGRHLRYEPIEDMPESRLLKTLVYKAKWQGEEEFMSDIKQMGLAIVRQAMETQLNHKTI